MQFNVVTYNIHKGFSPGKVKFMLPKMRDALEAINPDLILLQEVQGEHKRQEKRIKDWPDQTQFEFIADTLWPHHAYGKNAIYQAGHHGNAILSKYPFARYDNINVATTSRASRSLLHGVIDLKEHHAQLHVICIHFGLFTAERSDQLSILCERIQQTVPDDEPLLIAGDFNDWRKRNTDALEQELGLKETFKEIDGDYAKSFPAWGPTLRTDRIYYRGLDLVDCQRLKEKRWRILSDHLPLLATFSLP